MAHNQVELKSKGQSQILLQLAYMFDKHCSHHLVMGHLVILLKNIKQILVILKILMMLAEVPTLLLLMFGLVWVKN